MNHTEQTEARLHQFHQDAWAELRRATVDKKHPFRYFVLASMIDNQVYQRTLALRSIDKKQHIWAYTDFRTPKVKQLQANPHASLLFFHPKKWLQIRIQTTVQIHYQDEETAAIWKNIPIHSQKDYTTKLSPSTSLETSKGVEYLEGQANYFCRIAFIPQNVEILQIRREGHLRAKFQWQNTDWKGTWLVP
jgi:pyridoxine/pyridoxamine 5'-phosphate oxidase